MTTFCIYISMSATTCIYIYVHEYKLMRVHRLTRFPDVVVINI